MTVHEILLLHHSHTDIGYTHYQDTVFAFHRDYIRQALDLAERYAGNPPGEQFKWTCETTVIVEDFLRHAAPADIDRLQALHQQGLIDFGGLYTNGTPLYSTELLARTLSVAGALRRDYGFDIRYAMNCDVNGQSWGLADMLLDAGFDGLLMAINRAMARDPQPRPRAFRWQSRTGRDLLVWHGEHYGEGNNYGIPLMPFEVPGLITGKRRWQYDIALSRPAVQRYLDAQAAQDYPYDFVFFQAVNTLHWDNDGPQEALVRFVQEWNANGWQPRMRLVGLHELFERVSTLTLDTHSGDWSDWWAQGGGSSAYETALNRQSEARWWAVESLAALLPQNPLDAPTAEQAWRSLALYDEHTWGSSDSIAQSGSAQARGQWYRKAAYAYDGAALVSRMIQEALRGLTQHLPAADAPQVVLYNPLPWARRCPVLLPAVYETGWERERLEKDLLVASPQSAVGAHMDYGIIDLPAGGYVTLPMHISPPDDTSSVDVRLPEFVPLAAAPPATRVRRQNWRLENDFYRLVIDPVSGGIRQWSSAGRDWVDAGSGWLLGQYVYERLGTPRGRDDMMLPPYPPQDYDYRPHLAPQRSGPDAVREVRFVAGAGHGRLCLRLNAPGVRDLRVQIVLYDDLPWVDLIYDFDKLPVAEPESVYITFPLALDQPTAHYEVAGTYARAEADQLPYACRDFYAVQRWVDLSDARGGVTVATPDAPLLHLGGFTNHNYRPQVTMEQPYLVGWPLNNHWCTNFAPFQQGWTRIRYRLLAHETPFDPVAATRFGAEAAVEPLAGPVYAQDASLPGSASLVTLEPAAMQLIALRPAPGGGVSARVQALEGGAFSLRFPGRQVAGAEVCDLLDNPLGAALPTEGDTVRGTLAVHQTLSLRVSFVS